MYRVVEACCWTYDVWVHNAQEETAAAKTVHFISSVEAEIPPVGLVLRRFHTLATKLLIRSAGAQSLSIYDQSFNYAL